MRKILSLIVISILLVSCRTHKVATADFPTKVRTDTVMVDRYMEKVDSVYMHDSIFTMVKGDTVTTDRWHTQYKYKYITRTRDSIQVRVDSIPYRVEVEKRVAYIPAVAKFLAVFGGIVLIGMIGYIIILILQKTGKL